jgi:hypothetical protein
MKRQTSHDVKAGEQPMSRLPQTGDPAGPQPPPVTPPTATMQTAKKSEPAHLSTVASVDRSGSAEQRGDDVQRDPRAVASVWWLVSKQVA